MRPAVDIHGTHAADPFAAVVVKGDGILTFGDQFFIEHVKHFKERHLRRNTGDIKQLKPTRR